MSARNSAHTRRVTNLRAIDHDGGIHYFASPDGRHYLNVNAPATNVDAPYLRECIRGRVSGGWRHGYVTWTERGIRNSPTVDLVEAIT